MAHTKVTKPGIADDAVETTTIKNLNVTNAKIAAGTIDVTAKITGIVPPANLGTGTASSSTVLYGDGTYKAEPGGAILQVKAGMYYGSTIGSTTSTTPVSVLSLDSDFTTATSVAITPASVSSKFHITVQVLVESVGAKVCQRFE